MKCKSLILKFSLSAAMCSLSIAALTQTTPVTAATAAKSAVPRLINYSGILKSSDGKTMTTTTGVTFLLYRDDQGGAPLWLETQNVTPDRMGHYSVQLGTTSVNGLPSDLFVSGEARWLAVQVAHDAEPARVLLVAVPYAMKAADAETVGGLPPSAFVLAAPMGGQAAAATSIAGTAAPSTAATPVNPAVTGVGTAGSIPLWDSASDLTSSAIVQTGSGSTARIGINTPPTATFDVKGTSNFRGSATMPSAGLATASAGKNSYPFVFATSVYNSGKKAAVLENFRWQAEPVGNNSASPTGKLNLLFSSGTATPAETGLSIASNGQVTFASGQTFPGTGTITGVTAGTGLTGGGTTGTVTLNVDSTKVPFLNIANTFSTTQTASSDGGVGFFGESNSSYGLYGLSTSGYGVVGVSSTGTGSYGGSGSSYGVYGSSSSNDAVHAVSSTGTGVYAQSSSGYGVYGTSPNNYGVVGVTTSGNGVYGQVSVAPQAGTIGRTLDSSGNWGMYAFGNIGATGTKSSVVPVDNGTRQVALYAVESPGVWFEDYGSGRLVSGVATVRIDPAYAQTVNTGVEYHVFLTPDGDCEGLYVTARTATGFEVRELHQGKSNVAFDYRVIALRRGYETKRLADVTNATPRSTIETLPLEHAGSAAGTATAK
jgi:hypothetical protein